MNYYKLTFTFKKWHFQDGVKVAKTHEYQRVIEAENQHEANKEAERIAFNNSEVDCKFVAGKEIEKGKIWEVSMDGTAHHDVYNREDMHKVMFVDALDMYDAEQIAYRRWEREVKEDGWNDISIYRTMVFEPEKKN